VPQTVEGVEVEWYDNKYDYYDIYLPYNTQVSSTRIDFELNTVKSLAGSLPDRNCNDEGVEMKISPNPISESGSIIVNMSGEYNGMVELSIYDISGRKLKTIYDGSGSGGEFVYSMEMGDYITSGTYLAVLKTADDVISKKFVVMR
jgi:hypothetical protein